MTEGCPLPLLPLGADFLQPRARGALGFGERSAPMNRRPSLCAAASVVPEPENYVQHGVARRLGAGSPAAAAFSGFCVG